MFRIVELFLFDVCTGKCAYCHFAETGKVLDNSQMKPYRDPDFIDSIVRFFNSRTKKNEKWLLTLTGGEPLLMANLDRFVDGLYEAGNKVAFYSALLVGENSPGFRYLVERAARATDYIMASFHAEAEKIEDKWFAKIGRLKQAGHRVIVRFVGHPKRLTRLHELAIRCRDLDVAFHPTPLFSPIYPSSYTPHERAMLLEHAVSLSQIIQLEGGIDTVNIQCDAGSNIIAIDMRTGVITPCISVDRPILGNIYNDTCTFLPSNISCPLAGVSCSCDIHFQQNIVCGVDDHIFFKNEKASYVKPVNVDSIREQITGAGLRFSKAAPNIGQTDTADFCALEKHVVKQAYETNRRYFEGEYDGGNHPEFKRRQFQEVKEC
jgi:organic radical activating enzyme